MATKKDKSKKKPKVNPPGGNYEALGNKDPVGTDGRARYWDTFDLYPQTSLSSRYVTFRLPEKIKGPVAMQFDIIKGDPSWPTFTAYNIATDVIPSYSYACRIATIGWPVEEKFVYKCKIQVWATPNGGKGKKKAKKKSKK